MIRFALNRTCSPQMDLRAFISMASLSGAPNVELRSDIEGQEFANGMSADELKSILTETGIGLASINALQRFNDWTSEREAEACDLIGYSARLGAPGIVLCPVIDTSDPWSEAESSRRLRQGLGGLAPILRDNGLIGYVEPLGMKGSTMSRQAQAVEAVESVAGWDVFAICHDTFQFYRCGDDRMFPEHVGLVHISGIGRSGLAPEELAEPDRGFVGEDDLVGNIRQLRELIEGGYAGFVSMEPFSPTVQTDPKIVSKLAKSIAFVRSEVDRVRPSNLNREGGRNG